MWWYIPCIILFFDQLHFFTGWSASYHVNCFCRYMRNMSCTFCQSSFKLKPCRNLALTQRLQIPQSFLSFYHYVYKPMNNSFSFSTTFRRYWKSINHNHWHFYLNISLNHFPTTYLPLWILAAVLSSFVNGIAVGSSSV
jgi:hypothetical protein